MLDQSFQDRDFENLENYLRIFEAENLQNSISEAENVEPMEISDSENCDILENKNSENGMMDISENHEIGEYPEISENPETSENPEISENPESSQNTETFDNPEIPETSETHENSQISKFMTFGNSFAENFPPIQKPTLRTGNFQIRELSRQKFYGEPKRKRRKKSIKLKLQDFEISTDFWRNIPKEKCGNAKPAQEAVDDDFGNYKMPKLISENSECDNFNLREISWEK